MAPTRADVPTRIGGLLAFKPFALDAAGNTAIGEPLRYLVQRLVELLDDQTHFSRSASQVVDPVTAVREFFDAGHEFLGSPDFRYPTMVEAFQTTQKLLAL